MATDWTNIINLVSGTGLQLYSSDVTASGYDAAADAAIAGGSYSANVYRQAGLASLAMADYNNKIVEANKNAAINTVQTQVREIFNNNVASQGASGVSMSSKSFLAVANASISKAEADVLTLHNNAQQQEATNTYNAQLQQTAYENQARATEYKSQIAAAQSQFSASATRGSSYGKAVTGLLSGVTSLLS